MRLFRQNKPSISGRVIAVSHTLLLLAGIFATQVKAQAGEVPHALAPGVPTTTGC